ncbi:hypothetical protein [Micromonospora arida]
MNNSLVAEDLAARIKSGEYAGRLNYSSSSDRVMRSRSRGAD